jgi:enoyl-CoA hydratase
MTSYTCILTETRGSVGLVRLNRPKALNALNREMLKEIMDALFYFDTNEKTSAMVITGNEHVFAAGADIQEMSGVAAGEMLRGDWIAQFDRISQISKPLIAAVSGYCLGGGNELALSCDMIVASETARFGQPEINLGVIPGAGGTQRLSRVVGKAVAMEMVLNNRTLTAEEALQFGLVNKIAPVGDYLDEALELAGEIANRAPLAVRMAKKAVNKSFEMPLSEGISAERMAFYLLFSTEDQKEGIQAFLNKRKPKWKGK